MVDKKINPVLTFTPPLVDGTYGRKGGKFLNGVITSILEIPIGIVAIACQRNDLWDTWVRESDTFHAVRGEYGFYRVGRAAPYVAAAASLGYVISQYLK